MQQREKLNPSLGATVRFALDHDPEEAKQVDGIRGIEYQLIVNDDSGILWIPAAGRQALTDAGAQQGHLVDLTRGRKEWTARVIEPDADPRGSAAPPPPVREMPRTESRAETALRQQAQLAQHITQGSSALAPQPQATAAPAQAAAQPQRPGASLLAGAILTALDAVIYAEEYSRAKGRAIHFASEDIRAMAISLYIDARKEVR